MDSASENRVHLQQTWVLGIWKRRGWVPDAVKGRYGICPYGMNGYNDNGHIWFVNR